jgi:hypothetical protein
LTRNLSIKAEPSFILFKALLFSQLNDKHISLDDRDVSSNLMGVGGQTFSPADLASDSGQVILVSCDPF